MVRGITFAEQLITSDDFSHFMYTFLNKANGVTKGCEISTADSNIYIQKGYFIQFGRMVQIVGTETIETPEVQSGTLYCRLVFEIDLSKNNTAESFSQGYFKTLSSASEYPEVTQQNLDSGGTIYQSTWATYVKGVEGISNFRDVRPILNLDAVWNAVSNQNASYKAEFDEYFASQKSVIEQMILDLQDEGFASQGDLNALASKVDEIDKNLGDHSHDASDIATGEIPVEHGGTGAATAEEARANLGLSYGSAAGTVCQGNDSRLSDARTPTVHKHAAGDINSGTLPVARGGTGVATMTSGAALIGNGTGAPTFRAITNLTAKGAASASTNLATANTVVYHAQNRLNRTGAVNEADTGYATYMARGIALVTAEPSSLVNGACAFVFS